MPLRFGPYLREDEPRAKRGPPDYTSGWVRYRLFVLVALVIGVLTLMTEARKPKHYEWLWKLGQSEEDGLERVRLDAPASPPEPRAIPPIPLAAEEIPGAFRGDRASEHSVLSPKITSAEDELFERARRDGWDRLFDQVDEAEREAQHDLLFALLRSARSGTPLEEKHRQPLERLLESLDRAWSAFRAEALASLATLSEDDKARWLSILNRLETDWTAGTLPALRGAAEGNLEEAQRVDLARLQTLLDELALAAVRDDTVPNRSVERFAWFRLFEALGGAEPDDLRRASHGTVGFVQLLKQSKDYRGKVITVRGRIELGYRVPAFENVEGIRQYYVFWLRPAGGDDSPLVIYALETPAGFPEVREKDADQQKNRMGVEVEIDGYLFKRMAYASKQGTLTTPLLLARAPAMLHLPVETAADPRKVPPSARNLLWILIGSAAFGMAVALFAYFSTSAPRRAAARLERLSTDDLQRLSQLEIAESSPDGDWSSNSGAKREP